MAHFPPYFLPQSYLLLWLFYVLALGMSNLHKPVITSWYGALTNWSGLALAMLERSCFEGDIYLWDTALVLMIAESVLLVTRELSLHMQIHRAWPSSARSSSLVQYSPMNPSWCALGPGRPLLDDFYRAALDSSNLPVLEQGWETWRSLILDQWSHIISRQTCGLKVLTTSKPESQVFGLDMHLHVRFSAIDSARRSLRSCCLLVSSCDHTEACQTCDLEAVSTWRLEVWKPPIWSRRASSSSVTDSTWRFFQKLSSSGMMLRVFEDGLGSHHTWAWNLYVSYYAQCLCPPHGPAVIAVLCHSIWLPFCIFVCRSRTPFLWNMCYWTLKFASL